MIQKLNVYELVILVFVIGQEVHAYLLLIKNVLQLVIQMLTLCVIINLLEDVLIRGWVEDVRQKKVYVLHMIVKKDVLFLNRENVSIMLHWQQVVDVCVQPLQLSVFKL
jgi:hypothetical protein